MDYSDPGEHESEAERNNRVLEEWFRTAFHLLLNVYRVRYVSSRSKSNARVAGGRHDGSITVRFGLRILGLGRQQS